MTTETSPDGLLQDRHEHEAGGFNPDVPICKCLHKKNNLMSFILSSNGTEVSYEQPLNTSIKFFII